MVSHMITPCIICCHACQGNSPQQVSMEGIELVHLILLQEEEKMPINFNITFLADSKIVVV